MKVSLMYGKKCESTAGKPAYVIRVNANGMKIVSLTCADGDEKEFTVAIGNVRKIKNKIYYAEGTDAAEIGTPLRLGRPVFNSEGKFLGHLSDFTVENNEIVFAHVGKKKFSADDIVCGDAVIIKKQVRVLKSDVKKDGKVIIKRGTPLTPEVLEKACEQGEYVQANLKSI